MGAWGKPGEIGGLLVSYSTGHLAHRCELLRLAQRLFSLPPLGYIEKGEDIAAVGHRMIVGWYIWGH